MNQKVTAKDKFQQRMLSLGKALKLLQDVHSVYLKQPNEEIYQMALIQSFEFSFELSWNVIKYFIEYNELAQLRYARDVIKQAFHKGIISDGQVWLDMLENRNKLSHVYDKALTKDVIQQISKVYVKLIEDLYIRLKGENL